MNATCKKRTFSHIRSWSGFNVQRKYFIVGFFKQTNINQNLKLFRPDRKKCNFCLILFIQTPLLIFGAAETLFLSNILLFANQAILLNLPSTTEIIVAITAVLKQ